MAPRLQGTVSVVEEHMPSCLRHVRSYSQTRDPTCVFWHGQRTSPPLSHQGSLQLHFFKMRKLVPKIAQLVNGRQDIHSSLPASHLYCPTHCTDAVRERLEKGPPHCGESQQQCRGPFGVKDSCLFVARKRIQPLFGDLCGLKVGRK